MRRFIFSSLLLVVATWGCADSEPVWTNIRPSADQIQRLEARLRQQDCIGDLSEWERRYQFWTDVNRRSATYGKTDKGLIMFKLRKGSADYPIKPARTVFSSYPSLSFEIDDRPGQAAAGKFNTSSDDLTMESCGYSRGG